MVTNSTVKQQKSHPLVERKVEGAELAKAKTPVGSKKEEEKEEEEDGGSQSEREFIRQNVCVINACQVSFMRGSR